MKRAARDGSLRGGGGRSIVRIFKPALRMRIAAFLTGAAAPLSQNELDGQVEDVRALMLAHLGLGQVLVSSLFRRIQYATDIQVLWYLRSDLMVSLAFAHGESMAKREMTEITEAFQAALPKALRTPVGRPEH